MIRRVDQKLLNAVKEDNLEAAKAALEKGACIFTPNEDGYSAFRMALHNRVWNMELFSLIASQIKKGARFNDMPLEDKAAAARQNLIDAVHARLSDVCLKLIEMDDELHQLSHYSDSNHYMALAGAAMQDLPDVCAKLIEKGTYVNGIPSYPSLCNALEHSAPNAAKEGPRL